MLISHRKICNVEYVIRSIIIIIRMLLSDCRGRRQLWTYLGGKCGFVLKSCLNVAKPSADFDFVSTPIYIESRAIFIELPAASSKFIFTYTSMCMIYEQHLIKFQTCNTLDWTGITEHKCDRGQSVKIVLLQLKNRKFVLTDSLARHYCFFCFSSAWWRSRWIAFYLFFFFHLTVCHQNAFAGVSFFLSIFFQFFILCRVLLAVTFSRIHFYFVCWFYFFHK